MRIRWAVLSPIARESREIVHVETLLAAKAASETEFDQRTIIRVLFAFMLGESTRQSVACDEIGQKAFE